MLLHQYRLMPTFGLAFFMLFTTTSCEKTVPPPVQLEGMVGTATWHVTVNEPSVALDRQTLTQALDQVLQRTNQTIASWDATSELSRFNQSPSTDWVTVSPELAQLVHLTLQISEQSAGIYDVTVGPLIKLWGFSASGTQQDHVPSQAEIDTARAKVGYHKLQVRLDPPALRKSQADLKVELASVADGFAVDQVGQYLESRGIANYMVEVAGEIRTRGNSPRGDHWRIGIEKPIELGRAVQQGIHLQKAGLATSGDYRNFFTEQGKRYSHTLNPATGYPVQHSLASVSVIADDATTADAYATTLMAMGEAQGRTFAEQHHLKAYFIWRTDTGFASYATPQFAPAMLP